jgi:hypothetical protein
MGSPQASSSRSPSQEGVAELSTSECLALLRRSVIGRLAVVLDDQPDIFPVNHVVDQGTIVFRTREGTKLAACADRRIAFEVDGYDTSDASAWSVVVKGRARVILETYESIEALQLPLFPWQAGSKPYFIRIDPYVMTGRRFHVSGGVTGDSGATTPGDSGSASDSGPAPDRTTTEE